MIECSDFYKALLENNAEYFCGVPDSLLKSICAYIADNAPEGRHVITANEGAAIAMAAGWYLGTEKPAVVYMQNSGIGNAVNPLLSLTDPAVYGIPMILLIGWRGEPGVKDEPQHIKQGEVTLSLLDALGISYSVIDGNTDSASKIIEKVVRQTMTDLKPGAIVVRKNTFLPYSQVKKKKEVAVLSREEAVSLVASFAGEDAVIISTTGMISRELFEYRERNKTPHNTDFLTVGSMGHSSQIAFGVASAKPGRKIYCLDGDGAVIMHMGSLAINGVHAPANLVHIVFNNEAHDSVGGQMTVGGDIDLASIALSCRYKTALKAETEKEVAEAFKKINSAKGPVFLEIKVRKGARNDLGRPTLTPRQQKEDFMKFLCKNNNA